MAGSPRPGLVSKAESVVGCGEPMICKRFLPGMAAYSSAFVPCVYVCLSFAYTSLSPKTCDSAHFCESAAARYLLCRHLFDVGVCCSFLPLMRVGPPFPLLLSVSWAGSVSSAGFCSLEHNPNKRRNSPLSLKNCCKLQGCWINFQKAKIRPAWEAPLAAVSLFLPVSWNCSPVSESLCHTCSVYSGIWIASGDLGLAALPHIPGGTRWPWSTFSSFVILEKQPAPV